MSVLTVPTSTDPQVYDLYHQRFHSDGLPKHADGWLQRARDVGEILAADAPRRDIENKSPRAEIALLKSAGLLKVLAPAAIGGGGQSWELAYKLIREVAKGDGSIGMLLGYHLLWSTTANVVGTDEQKARFQKLIIENNFFVGAAVNPRDSDLKITSDGDEILFNGYKNFSTGGAVSDLIVLEGVYDGAESHIFTMVPTHQPGMQFKHDWNNIGLRLTESGGVKIENVRAPWKDAFGWDAEKKEIIDAILKIPFATLMLPTIQLVFSNFYLGIALGALDKAAEYTASSTRAWPFGGDNKEKATDEFYILERYGNFKAHLRAAEALVDYAGVHIATVYANHAEKRDVTAQARGDVAEWVTSAKIVTTDTGLTVTSGIFEVLGARATGKPLGFDKFWRDIRTHTVHDPVAYKNRELGRYILVGEIPEPTRYT